MKKHIHFIMLWAVILSLLMTNVSYAAILPANNTLADNLLAQKAGTPKMSTQTILVNQKISTTSMYSDYESDPELSRQWTIAHDPTAVENNDGLSTLHNTSPAALPTSFDKPGMYYIKGASKDNPGLGSFQKWSADATTVIRVHRKPTAKFGVTTSGNSMTVTDYSFDIDASSKSDRGIGKWQWTYWDKETGAVNNGIPTWWDPSRTMVISVTVWDYDGATDTYTQEVSATAPNLPPTTKVIAPPKVYVNQTFKATDISTPGTGKIEQWSWSTSNNAFGNSYTTTNPISKDYTIRFTAPSAGQPVSLSVWNSLWWGASDTKYVQVVQTSITGTDYLNKYPGETIALDASTINVVSQDHDVRVKVFAGVPQQEKLLLLNQTGTNSWNNPYMIPEATAPGSYTLLYEVVYRGTSEVLSTSTRTLTVVDPPKVDLQYRIKKPVGYHNLTDRLVAYFGNKGAETVNAADVFLKGVSPIWMRQWKDSKGNTGAAATFEHTFTSRGPITTTLRVQDAVSRLKDASRQWSPAVDKTIDIQEVVITPTTKTAAIIPERLFDIAANITSSSVDGAINPDLKFTATVMKKVNGVTSAVSPALNMSYVAGSSLTVPYAFNSGTRPADSNHQYWIQFDVTSNRSGQLIAQETQEIPLVLPKIVGQDYESLPFYTIELQAETSLVDPALHWVRVRIPDAEINFSSAQSDMTYDPEKSIWSMYYTVPMVGSTKAYPLLYEVISKQTGQVVISDTRSITIRPPAATADNPAQVHVYDVAPLHVETTDVPPDLYDVTATVFGKTVNLEYNFSTDDWSYDLGIPKDYSGNYSVVYNIIPKAKPTAAVITITKPLEVLTWLKNARFIDAETGERVTELIPKKTYQYEVESSLNVERVQIFDDMRDMSPKEVEIEMPVIGTVTTVEDTTDPLNRHITWIIETTFEYDYPQEVGWPTILPGSIPYKGTTYDDKTLTLNQNHTINISMDIDWKVPSKVSRGNNLKISSSSDTQTGPVIKSNIPLDHVDIWFDNTIIGNLSLQTPDYSNNVYTYPSDLFEYLVPASTPEGFYDVQIRATAQNQSFTTRLVSIQVVINQPPVANFTCTPNPAWEGDTINCINQSTDPDGDTLTSSWSITGPGGFSSTQTVTNAQINGSSTENKPGSYTVTLTVTDPFGLTSTITKTVMVGALTIAGQVNHTAEWEQNRQNWNTANPDAIRPANTFWAGEGFDLVGIPTDTTSAGGSTTTASSISVVANGIGNASLSKQNITRWTGYIGQDTTTTNLEALSDGPYDFTFTVTYSNGVKKAAIVTIDIVGNWNDYFRFHRKY